MMLANMCAGIVLVSMAGVSIVEDSDYLTHFGFLVPDHSMRCLSVVDQSVEPIVANRPEGPLLAIDLRLIREGGRLFVEGYQEAGGYEIACTARDYVCTLDGGFPTIAVVAGESDFFPEEELPGEECECDLTGPWVINPQVDFLQSTSGSAQFVFLPDVWGTCADFPNCPRVRSQTKATAANTLIFTVQDVNEEHLGNIKMKAKLSVSGHDQIEDFCSASSWIKATAKALYSSPPSFSTTTALSCGTGGSAVVASFSGISHVGKADETESMPFWDSGWIDLTGPAGIPQDQTFSLGFLFKLEGRGLHDHRNGSITLAIAMEPVL